MHLKWFIYIPGVPCLELEVRGIEPRWRHANCDGENLGLEKFTRRKMDRLVASFPIVLPIMIHPSTDDTLLATHTP